MSTEGESSTRASAATWGGHHIINRRVRRAVAFRLYDLDRTGDIQPSEVARLLGALLLNIPDIALDDASIQKIVDQASATTFALAQLLHSAVPLARSRIRQAAQHRAAIGSYNCCSDAWWSNARKMVRPLTLYMGVCVTHTRPRVGSWFAQCAVLCSMG